VEVVDTANGPFVLQPWCCTHCNLPQVGERTLWQLGLVRKEDDGRKDVRVSGVVEITSVWQGIPWAGPRKHGGEGPSWRFWIGGMT
jgi:hypothetical protein